MKAPGLWESHTGKKASSISNVLAQLVAIESKMQVHSSEMKRFCRSSDYNFSGRSEAEFQVQFTAVNSHLPPWDKAEGPSRRVKMHMNLDASPERSLFHIFVMVPRSNVTLSQDLLHHRWVGLSSGHQILQSSLGPSGVFPASISNPDYCSKIDAVDSQDFAWLLFLTNRLNLENYSVPSRICYQLPLEPSLD